MEDMPEGTQHIELQPYGVWAHAREGVRASGHGVDFNRLPAYWVKPFRDEHSNACAQAAMASLLVYWHKVQATPTLPYEFMNNGATNPNLLGGLLGTNWERVRDVLKAYGLNVQGFNNAYNQKYDSKYLIDMLASYTNQGCPPLLVIGNGELEPGDWGAHWWILCDIDQHNARMVNDGNQVWTYPTDKFLDAWRADGLPWTHHAGVIAWP